MKRLLHASILVVAALLAAHHSSAQPWKYDFGTGTASLTLGIDSTNAVLPAPPFNGGKARAKIGSGAGSFNIEHQLIAFGSGSYLRGVAPTGSSVNKMSVYNFAPGQAFTMKFLIRFGSSAGAATTGSGTWSMYAGDSSSFYDNSSFTGRHLFMGIKWVFGTSGTITTTFRSGTAWIATGLNGTPFAQGATYVVEVYGNNSTVDLPYAYNGARSVAPNTFDLWIDGILVGDNLAKGQLSDGANIDSWMFNGESSAGNTANIFLDNIEYHNGIADNPLPVQLASLRAVTLDASNVTVAWRTMSEINNYGFDVEKSTDSTSFTTIANSFVPGNGTTNIPSEYSFTFSATQTGTWFYRLRQIDLDGSFHFSEAVKVSTPTGVSTSEPVAFALEQNYPNPFNPTTVIRYRVPALSGVEGPALSGVEGPALSGVQGPALSGVEGPALSGVEGPALSGVEGVSLSGVNATDAGRQGSGGVGGRGAGVSGVRLVVYDVIGREVAVLVNEQKQAGDYAIPFSANLPSGIYMYRLSVTRADGNVAFTDVKKMTLLK